MSLLTSESQKCMLIVKTSVDDGHGAEYIDYVGGAIFDAVITASDSTNATKDAGNNEISALKVKVLYPCGVPLELHSIFKVLDTGKTYKVTSSGNTAANASTIRYNLTYAEEWSVPNG